LGTGPFPAARPVARVAALADQVREQLRPLPCVEDVEPGEEPVAEDDIADEEP